MKKLSDETARLISSGQVVTSISNSVKELVENALDANATNIEIKLERYGLGKIEVRDNGCGIPASDMQYVARRHFTSKIETHNDLQNLSTYGFRGEALSSLCEVSDVSVTTRTKDELYSTVYVLDSKGLIKSQKPSHISQGTTVTVSNIFKNLPVRRQFYNSTKKQKEQLKLTEDLIMAYSVALPSIQFKLINDRMVIWHKPKLPSSRSALMHVLGSGVQISSDQNCCEDATVEIFIPKNRLCRRSCDRCFVIVNKRPIRHKEIDKILKSNLVLAEEKKSAGWPVALVTITVPTKSIDVNVNANKSEVMLTKKEIVLDLLMKLLQHGESSHKNGNDHSRIIDECESTIEMTDNDNNNANIISPNHISAEDNCNVLSTNLNNIVPVCQPDAFNENILIPADINIICSEKDALISKDNNLRVLSKNALLSIPVSIDTGKEKERNTLAVYQQAPVAVMDTVAAVPKVIAPSVDVTENCKQQIQIEEVEDDVSIVPNFNIFSQFANLSQQQASIPESMESWSRGNIVKDQSGANAVPVKILQRSGVTNGKDVDKSKTKRRHISDSSLMQTTLDKVVRVTGKGQQPRSIFEICCDETGEDWDVQSEAKKQRFSNLASEEYDKYMEEKKRSEKCQSKKRSRNSFIDLESNEDKEISSKFNLDFSLEKLKNSLKNSTVACEDVSFEIVGFLSDYNASVVHHHDKLYVVNLYRLQECVIFYNLVKTHKFTCVELEFPLDLNEGNLGKGLIGILRSLSYSSPSYLNPDEELTDERIVCNGFKIKKFGNTSFQLVSMTTCVHYYGVTDLKEVLSKIAAKVDANIQESRPSKVIYYLEGEAARVAKSSPLQCDKSQVVKMLESLNFSPRTDGLFTATCFHKKPIFHQISAA